MRFCNGRMPLTMPEFCDVALAVPLDMAFTYACPKAWSRSSAVACWCRFASSACRAWLSRLHDRKPEVQTKNVIGVLDAEPVLDEQLIRLGQWIADYYLAPIGEVFRTMLPLSAEFKRTITYRITADGQMALHLAGMSGSSARSRKTPEDQLAEFRVLDYLSEREAVREQSLRGATRVPRSLLSWNGAQEVDRAGRSVRCTGCGAHGSHRIAQECRRQAQSESAACWSTRWRRPEARIEVETLHVARSAAQHAGHAGEARTGRDRRGSCAVHDVEVEAAALAV